MMQMFSQRPFLILLLLSVVVPAIPAFSTEAEPIYYGDCAYIQFDDIDTSQMTREEQLAAMDADFEDSLNASEACMSDAISSGSEKLADAGGNSGQGNGDGAETANTEQSTQAATATQQQTTQSQQRESTTEQTRSHSGGQGQQSSSAVCDAVKQGLESATTENEKAHFQALMTEYGCS